MGSALVVLDASAAVDLVAGRPAAAAVEDAIRGQQVQVPAHFDAEVLAGIRRLTRKKLLALDEGAKILARLGSMQVDRVPLPPLLAAAFAERDRFSPHGALYAVLARRESATLVTVDERFARACEGFVDVTLAQSFNGARRSEGGVSPDDADNGGGR